MRWNRRQTLKVASAGWVIAVLILGLAAPGASAGNADRGVRERTATVQVKGADVGRWSPSGCTRLIGDSVLGPLDDPCPGIRPGSQIVNSTGRVCTINFVFSDRKRWYVGTAGHCVEGKGDQVRAVNPDMEIGRVIYHLLEGNSRDFALIRVGPKARRQVETEGCGWGGPSGLAKGPQPQQSEVRHMGYGTGFTYIPLANASHSLAYARQGVALEMSDEWQLGFIGAVSPGDSGSGAYLSDGRAVGVITAVGFSSGPSPGTALGGRIDAHMREASRVLKKKLFLVTAEGDLVR